MLTEFHEEALDLSRRIQAVIEDAGVDEEVARFALAISTVLRHGNDLPLLIRISRSPHGTGCVEVEVTPGRVQ
jgi:hypothetical protein